MKYLVTLIQVLYWILIDSILFIYYFKWNLYLFKPNYNGFLKQENGITRRANNTELHQVISKNKYVTALS